jgi:hypothetical protein
MFLCLVAAYLVLFFAAAVACSRREGYWAPVTIFGIAAFYYYLSTPLELFLRGESAFITFPSEFSISPATRVAIGWCALLALAGFVAGHRLSGLGRAMSARDDAVTRRLPTSFCLLSVAVSAVFFVLFRHTVLDNVSYEDAYERQYSNPVFSFLTRLLILFGCLAIGLSMQRPGWRKWPAAAFAALVVGWGFYTSDKNPLLKAVLGVSTYWIGRRSRSMKHLYLYCGGAALTIAALPLFSAYRAQSAIDFRRAFTQFSVENTDARGPMISLVIALEDDGPRLLGSSYAYSLVAWIPRSIWPDRPYDLAQELAFEQIPHWEPGMGLGYSPLAEAYLNFGYAGAFLHYFVVAFCLGRLWRGLYNPLARHGAAAYWRALMAATYFETLILMHRMASSMIVQSCIHELLLPVAAFLVIDARRRARSPRRSGRPRLERPAGATPPVAAGSAANAWR